MGELIPVVLGILHDLDELGSVLKVESMDPFYDENNVLSSFHGIISVPADFEFTGPETELTEIELRGELEDDE
jgi:hypothetical protein